MLAPEISANIDASEFYSKLSKMLTLTSRSIEDEFEIQMRGAVRTVFNILPPAGNRAKDAGGGLKLAREARKSGFGSIRRDLRGGGTERGRRRAGVFTVLKDGLIDSAIETGTYGGDSQRLWVTKDGRIYGAQKHLFRPDASMGEMRAWHKKYFVNGRMSPAGTYTRDIGRWKWIDQMVVRESTYKKYEKLQFNKVGLYAAGCRPWADAVRAKVPMYVRRHSSGHGRAELSKVPGKVRFAAVNRFSLGKGESGVKRRVQWAFDVQANKMLRQLPFLVKRNARLAGLKT